MPFLGTLDLYNKTRKAEGGAKMKTRPEFRKIALDFAKRNGFDTVHFQGMLNNFEVYTGGYKVDCVQR